MITIRNICTAFTLALALVCLGGCVSSSRSNVTVQESVKFSKGQELNDLLRARQENAVTDAEYEVLRHIIMKRPN
jgi:hypothetical protein